MQFEFCENETYKTRVPVRITEEGKYKDIKFVYGQIKFVESEVEDQLGINFSYELIENPNSIEEDEELVTTLGNVLVEVLEDEMGQLTDEDFMNELEEAMDAQLKEMGIDED